MTNNSQLYLGCAVWSYPGWLGTFYPPKTKSGEFLNIYARQLNAVEGNTTFYAVPQAKTIDRWVQATNSGFKFCPKLPKTITHNGFLKSQLNQTNSFLEIVSGLKHNLGTIFIQLPPTYSPQYLADLRHFLTALPSQYSFAVEVRHLAWFQSPHREQLNQLLSELNIARVLLDTRPIYNCPDNPQALSKRKKPKLPLQVTTTNNLAFVRFISHPDLPRNQSYLEKWALQVRDWLNEGKTVYFFVHCPIEDHSPEIAKQFKDLLNQQGVNVDQIAVNPVSIPSQLSLF